MAVCDVCGAEAFNDATVEYGQTSVAILCEECHKTHHFVLMEKRASVRHVKRGTIYDIVATVVLQSSTPAVDGQPLILYRGKADGKLWVRPEKEMFDGRFE